jgi:crotonobetainyl-CoA:carnitine CoA-transferase CaiB-like acyl-CoA transferase
MFNQTGVADLPLTGMRVIDLTWYTSGPFCTRVLSDYGADVIKVERAGAGDPARSMPPFQDDEPGLERSGLFMFLNTNKRSVTLDLKQPEGRNVLLDLIRGADALVENFSPRVMSSLGLDYHSLKVINPRLVVTSISNFGRDGPYRDWNGSDLVLYGMGGPMLNTGSPDREPLKTAGHTPSFQVGATAATATTIGLWGSRASGSGEHVDVSYLETFMGLVDRRTTNLVNYEYAGDISTRPPLANSSGTGIWPTRDGGYFYTTVVAARWTAMARMIGQDDLASDPEWNNPVWRSAPDRIDEFGALVISWMIERTKKEIRAAVEEAGVYGAPINTIADVVSDEHLLERRFFQEIDHPTTGPLTFPGYSFRITTRTDGEVELPPRRRAPLLGEHTDEILRDDLGLGSEHIDALRAKGVI